MARILVASALALGAILMTGRFAAADEPAKSSITGGIRGMTMTLGGMGTAAQAATSAEDTELAWYHRGYYGGYSGWGGGWGGYRWGPYRNYLAFHPIRPFVNYRKAVFNPYYGPGYYGSGYYGGSYYGPSYYGVGSFGPSYYGGYGGYCYNGYGYSGWGGGYGGYYGIKGTRDDAETPAVSLNLAMAKNPLVIEPFRSNDFGSEAGALRYDGGPANPVPQVKPDAEPRTQAAPAAVGLPISFNKETKPASPYRYKAYGEK